MNREVRVPEAHSEAFRFFAIFARLEFSLKNLGHLKRQNGKLVGGRPMADWSVIIQAKKVRELFGKFKADDRVAYLMAHPPGYEVARDGGGIGFDPADPVETIDDLLLAIQRVRNNLFHGGKKPNGTERDRNLLVGAIIVIEAVIGACNDDIWYEFEGRF